MATPIKQNYRLEELEDRYLKIEQLYDLTEHFITTIESPQVESSDTQIALVEPLINEVTDATDVLTEEFISVARDVRGGSHLGASKTRVESAFRRIYAAMNDYYKRSARVYGESASSIRTFTDKIVDAIHRHAEEVIAIFVEFIQLTFNNIMSKSELDMLYQRQQKLALQMHSMGQGHHGS